MTTWSIGELPQEVDVTGSSRSMRAYPALVDEGETVGIRLLATEAEQTAAMWDGTIRLLLLNLPSPGRLLRPLLTADARAVLRRGPHADQPEWVADCLGCAVGEIISSAGGPAWDAVEFDALLARVRDELHPRVTAIGQESLEVFEQLAAVETAFNRLDEERHAAAIRDIADQVGSLIYPRFLTGIGSDRVPDLRRYLEAVERRIERLPQDPQRDGMLMSRIHAVEEELDRLHVAMPGDHRLIDVAWMIQELRVSFFAQAVGTRGKVSEKRVRAALAEIEMG
jgi:ATP-dependent helicase HrpA